MTLNEVKLTGKLDIQLIDELFFQQKRHETTAVIELVFFPNSIQSTRAYIMYQVYTCPSLVKFK